MGEALLRSLGITAGLLLAVLARRIAARTNGRPHRLLSGVLLAAALALLALGIFWLR